HGRDVRAARAASRRVRSDRRAQLERRPAVGRRGGPGGGLGLAPGGNVGDGFAVFEATHGTAPKYAGQDKVNPGSVILSGAMMFEELGWDDVATAIARGLGGAIRSRRVTYDLARLMPGATEVLTSAFAECILEHV